MFYAVNQCGYIRVINERERERNCCTELVGWLVRETCLTPSCLRRGPGGDRDPRRWGKREAIPKAVYIIPVPNASLASPECLLH